MSKRSQIVQAQIQPSASDAEWLCAALQQEISGNGGSESLSECLNQQTASHPVFGAVKGKSGEYIVVKVFYGKIKFFALNIDL